jgi:UDP-N-acetylmuramyl pentapeptide synthase
MTNQTNINEELNQEELNNESKTPEISKSQDIENNLDSELNIKNGKNELLQELQESNAAMKAEIEKITKIAATSQSQYITLKNEFDSYIRRIDSEKKRLR